MLINRTLEDLKSRLDYINEVIDYADDKLVKMPAGNLRIQHQRKSLSYYCARETKGDVNGHIITDPKLISDLAQKSYLRKVRRSAQEEQQAIKLMLESYPETKVEDIYSGHTQDRQNLITPIALSDDEYAEQWLAQPYQGKGFKDGDPNYITLKGERVRSKSEQIIADRLAYNNIPYKYECPLPMGDYIVYPDFTILRMSDRQPIYWEHFGMMSVGDYADSMVRKINQYATKGIVIGKNLIATFESSRTPLNTGTIDDIINAHFK